MLNKIYEMFIFLYLTIEVHLILCMQDSIIYIDLSSVSLEKKLEH